MLSVNIVLCSNYGNDDESVPDWNEDQPHDHRDFGRDELDWMWVVGVYYSATQVQFVRVKFHTSKNLITIIKKYVEPGSLIWDDQLAGYKMISEIGYEHESANHTKNCVDRETGVHTQGVERAWINFKRWYKASRGKNICCRVTQISAHGVSCVLLSAMSVQNF